MRIGVRKTIPLPGPFYVAPGRHRGSNGGWGYGVFAVLLLLGLCYEKPWIGLSIVGALVLLVLIAVVRVSRR